MSVVLYTNLFTVKGQNPKENKYISMFLIWFKHLIKRSGLTKDDTLLLMIDAPTAETLETYDIFSHLIDSAPFEFKAIITEQPSSLTAGIAARYTICDHVQQNSMVCYLDVDVLCVKPIRDMICQSLFENDLAIYLEGDSSGKYYLGELRDEIGITEEELQSTAGITGAIYCFRSTNPIAYHFNMLCKRIKFAKRQDITEQPYFNELIWNLRKTRFQITHIQENIVENILSNLCESTLLLNLCGFPGDGDFHWEKVLSAHLFLE